MITKTNKIVCKFKHNYYAKMNYRCIEKMNKSIEEGKFDEAEQFATMANDYLGKQSEMISEFIKDLAL